VTRRLLALAVLGLVVGGGYYFWRASRIPSIPRDLGEVGERVRNAQQAAKIGAALSLHGRLSQCRIRPNVNGGVVTLSGSVPSEDLRRRAAEIVEAVPGVQEVENRLQISADAPTKDPSDKRTIGEVIDDRTMEVHVRLALSLNRHLEDADIAVAVFRRQVTLTGEAASVSQRQAAVRLTRESAGVTDIVDRIQVKGGEPALVVEAEKALAANPNLSRYNLRVRQDGARTVISGRVHTGAEKDLAGLLTRSVTGGEVDNQVNIQ
jgi:hyperosmotically inducible protein